MEIRVLARQGRGIKAIARELGVSRNTVGKYVRALRAESARGRIRSSPQSLWTLSRQDLRQG